MKKKIFSILFALVLVCSFSLVTAVPVAAAEPETVVLGGDVATAVGAQGSSDENHIGSGSWQVNSGTMNVEDKMELYIDPTMAPFNSLGSFTVSEIQSISFATENGGTVDNVDFYFTIYTMPFTGGDAAWYGYRLTGEAMYSDTYNPIPDQWNVWTTDAGDPNKVVFSNSPRTAIGFYGAPTLADLQEGPINWGVDYPNSGATETIDYSNETVLFITFATGSGWTSTFDGYLDDITITLKDGTSLTVDLEEYYAQVWVDDVALPSHFANIQDGIDNVAEGGMVNVAAGTYTQSVLIAKPLTLRGPNAGISPNPPGSRVAEAVITGVSPLVRLPDGADVNPLTIEGFTFSVLDATAEPVGGSHNGSVILADGASDGWGEVTILSNRFIENYGPAIGVWTSLSEAVNPADWRITDNLIDGVRGTDRSGIYLDLVTDPATGFSGWEISNNTIKNTEYGGIMVHGAVDVVISGNTIEDVRKTGIQSSGVYGNVTITDNVITRAMLDHEPGAFRAGIRIYGTDLGDEYGPSQLIGPVWVTNNIVTDSYIGFATKLGHDFTAHEVHVNGNSFTGNSEAGLRHNGTGLLDATNNWWGNAIESQIAKLVSGNVDYSPWLDAAYPDGKSTSLDVTTISLASGWNLISLPLIPDDSAIETVLAGVTVNKVAYYTGGPEGSWLYYTGDLATSDLTQMQDGKGYWIDASTAGALTIRGYELCAPPPAVPPSYNLVEGWNLISFKSLATNTDVATYLGTAVTDAIEAMYGYDAAAGLYTIIKSTDTLVPGDGYWLAVSAEGTIYP